MSTPVIRPFLLDFGLVLSGQRVTSTLQVHPPSDAEVTAVMVQHDTGSFKVHQVVAYNVTTEPVDPRVPGAPAHTTEVAVPHYHAASHGQVPLVMRRDQWISWRWKLSQGEVLETEWTVLWRSLEQGGFPYADNFVLPSSETAISRRATVMRQSPCSAAQNV